MGKRGPKPRRTISEVWSPELAYAVGLLAADGCLIPKGHLINLTSKDKEQLENLSRCLGIHTKFGEKGSGSSTKRYHYVQFKNVCFYEFLVSIGLTPAKSKTIGPLRIPDKYFFDFLRGLFDGDGTCYSYVDPRWKTSVLFYTAFASASPDFIVWLRQHIQEKLGILGHVTKAAGKQTLQLKYAKADSIALAHAMYYKPGIVSLSRKRLKVERILGIVGVSL